MIVAIPALIGFVFGFIGGLLEDGPLDALGFSVVGTIAGAVFGLLLAAIFNPAFFS